MLILGQASIAYVEIFFLFFFLIFCTLRVLVFLQGDILKISVLWLLH